MKLRTAWWCGVSLCVWLQWVSSAEAQVTIVRPGGDAPWTYHMTVDPAPEPQPALKYRLLLSSQDRKPGNAAPYYYRANALMYPALDKELGELHVLIEKLGNTSKQLKEFPIERVRKLLANSHAVLDEVEQATRHAYCDWEINLNEMTIDQVISMRMAEFQNCRQLSRLLVLQAYLAIIEHRHDDAFEAIRKSVQIGHDVSQCPTILCGVIAAVIFHQSTAPLNDLLAEPNAPNFYWAFAGAERPFIKMRASLEQEVDWVFKVDLIREAEHLHTADEWLRMLIDANGLISAMSSNTQDFQSDYFKLADGTDLNPQINVMRLAMTIYPRAKQELARFGFTHEQVDAMPVIQVIAIHEARVAKYRRDELLKLSYLPYPQAAPLLREFSFTSTPKSASGRLSDMQELFPLFKGLHPALEQAMATNVRVDRRLLRLQVIEALRMYAAANNRRFPAKLADIQEGAFAVDPVTGTPISYRLEGQTAVIEFPMAEIPSYGEIIRVSLRKPN